jgi:hypothetical protein
MTSYGVLGIIASAALAGAVIVYRDQRSQINDANARADRMEAEKDALNRDVREKVVPLLTQVLSAMGSFVDMQRRGPRDGR